MITIRKSIERIERKLRSIFHLPTTGSKTACVACSSPIGVLNQIRFNLLAIGESSVDATRNSHKIFDFHIKIVQ